MSAMFVAFADASNLILNYQYKTVVVHISTSHRAFISDNFFITLTLIFCFRGSIGTQNSLLSCRNSLAADSAPKNHHFYMVDNAKLIKSGFPTSWAQMSSCNSLDGAQSSSYHSSLSTKVIINLSSILLTQLSFFRLRRGENCFHRPLFWSSKCRPPHYTCI